MKKKPSKGVIFWALFVIFNHCYYVFTIPQRLESYFLIIPSNIVTLIPKILTLIALLVNVGYIVLGISILLLSEFGRKLLLLIAAIDIFRNIVSLFEYSELWSIDPMIYLVIPIIGCIIASFLIYYLTRPKVKEQFK